MAHAVMLAMAAASTLDSSLFSVSNPMLQSLANPPTVDLANGLSPNLQRRLSSTTYSDSEFCDLCDPLAPRCDDIVNDICDPLPPIVVVVTFTLDTTVEAFDATAATAFKARLAAAVGVTPSQIELIVRAGSIIVEARITAMASSSGSDEWVAGLIQTALMRLTSDTAMATTILGVSVLSVSSPSVLQLSSSDSCEIDLCTPLDPLSPPPPAPPAPWPVVAQGDAADDADIFLSAWFLVAVIVPIGLVVLFALVLLCLASRISPVPVTEVVADGAAAAAPPVADIATASAAADVEMVEKAEPVEPAEPAEPSAPIKLSEVETVNVVDSASPADADAITVSIVTPGAKATAVVLDAE